LAPKIKYCTRIGDEEAIARGAEDFQERTRLASGLPPKYHGVAQKKECCLPSKSIRSFTFKADQHA